MPTTKWSFRNREVKPGDRIKVTHGDYNTKLVVRMATRADAGTYTVTADNVNGNDTAKVEVTVLGNFDSDPAFPNREKY